MDPLTQATVGAAAAALVCRKAEARHALLLGALAGAAPDLDVLIRSDSDPLLALEYHRHFTHAIIVAPLIGLLVAALFKGLFFWKHWPYRRLAPFGVIGALTHGVIDAFSEAEAREILPSGSVIEGDVKRFRFFSQGYLYRNPSEPEVVGDLRYAMFPDSVQPLWGIRLDPSEPDLHVSFEQFRDPSKPALDRLWSMVQGNPVEALD